MSRFRTELRRVQLACFVAQLACGLGWWLAFMVLAAVLVALCDWGFVLSEDVRAQLMYPALVLGIVLLVPVLWRAVAATFRLPAELDALNDDPRLTISSALKLPKQKEGGLTDWLTGQALKQAAAAVRCSRSHYPVLRRWLFALLVPVITISVLLGVYSIAPGAFSTLTARLLQPHEDVPPYSQYRFVLTPSQPQVYFGEDIALSCRVEGEPEPGALCLLMRAEGMPVQTLPVFVAQDGSYQRVLENVTAPCEVAFATLNGRARSHFIPIQVNYSPRILAGRVTITPLPYTGEPARELTLGGSEISVPDGGSISIELQCSCDIVSGSAYFTPADEQEPQAVPARAQADKLQVSMSLRKPGTLSLQVKDAAGREADSPVHVRLAVLPDSPPNVSIESPEDGSYLVAGEPLKVILRAEDDYALNRLTFFKAIAPYRQHGLSELQGRPRNQTVTHSYDTSALGLKPGDELELRAEVGDDNPFRFNIVSSPTTHVKIISSQEYVEILRIEVTYDEFLSRYEQLTESLAQVATALKSRDAAAARSAMESAHEIAQTLAKDFPIFDMDGTLSELSGKIAAVLAENLAVLSTLSEASSEQERNAAYEHMLSKLGDLSGTLAEQEQQARELALLVRAQEVQIRFVELVRQQEQLVSLYRRFMEEYGAASTSEPGKLEGLGGEQAMMMQEYVEWEEALSPLLAELGQHESLLSMYQMVFAMRHACEQVGVEGLMDQAVAESVAHHPANAHSYAAQALDGMQKLLQNECSSGSCSSAAQQCRDSMSAAAGNTLQQLLDAMQRRRGSNSSGGTNATSGSGRSAISGVTGERLLGPARNRLQRRSRMGTSTAPGGNSSTQGAGNRLHRHQTRPIGTPGADSPTYRESDTEMVPAGYRDAVRSYFSY
ncbi:MAG: hypothetical protein IKZ07_03585 [Akkermansia sp.]|nr:hypothetical protein [Akkermansia sp.]